MNATRGERFKPENLATCNMLRWTLRNEMKSFIPLSVEYKEVNYYLIRPGVAVQIG